MGRPKGSKNKPKVTESAPSITAKTDSIKYMSQTANQRTAEEMKEWYEKNKRTIANFENANEAIKQLQNVNSTTKYKSVGQITKDNLRSYLQNPSSNEKNIRNISRYLYVRSQVYYRLVKFYANMFDLTARSVIPPYSLVDKNNPKDTLQSYNDTLQLLDKMNLQYEFLKIYTQCWREDLFCGVAYLDETGFFVLPLDLDYTKVVGIRNDSTFVFAVDMTYFNKYPELLEYWGEPFQSMHSAYGGVAANKWQIVPDEYSVCLKLRADDFELAIPPMAGIFNALLSLISMEDLQDIGDEQDIYKLLVAKLPLLDGSDQPDDWAVDPSMALEYFNKMIDALPDYIGAVLSPLEIEPITFDSDQASDVSKIQKATQAVLNTSGGSQVLNGASISGTTAWTGAIKSDSEFAISMLLPQTEATVNRLLSFALSNPSKVKFFEVSIFTKDELRKSLMENATYGLPTRLAVNALTGGFSELDTLSLNFLETECLDLPNVFGAPLQSSHTTAGGGNQEGGAPIKDVKTDDGEASEDKRDSKK